MSKSVILVVSGLLLTAAVLALAGPAGCSDRLGCIQVSRQAPLEIAVLYASPGSDCGPIGANIAMLEQRAARAWRDDRLPIAILKEESGFSLESTQQALARLLSRPNLAAVWVLDCGTGTDPTLLKMIADAGIPAWQPDSAQALSGLFDRLAARVKACCGGNTGSFLIGRSSLAE